MDSLTQTDMILLGIATVLGLIVSMGTVLLMTPRRNRWLSALGALIGTAVGLFAVVYFIAANQPSLEAVSEFLGAVFLISMTALIGAVGFNFLSYVVGQQGGTSLEG